MYLRITQNRKSRYVSTGVFIHPQKWNPEREKVRKSHRKHKSLNTILEKVKDDAVDVQAELTMHGSDSAKAIRERLKTEQSGDFFDLAESLLKDLEIQKKYHPVKRLKVLIKKVKSFNGGRDLPLKHISTDWLDKFESYLRIKYGNGDNTISKDFEPLHKIIRMGLKEHLIPRDPFMGFEGAKRKRSKSKTKLDVIQIMAIEDLELDQHSWLAHSRDAFLFSFYSAGIRFGDICCLRWSDINNDRLSYQMNKNEKGFSMNLNKSQKDILSRYKGLDEYYIFPFLNSHKKYDPMELRQAISSKNAIVNKTLKEIAKIINKKIEDEELSIPKIDHISFHVSRHSYAQYAVESGLNVYEVMHTLRHSKIETTQKYLKSLNEELADKAMSKLF